MSVHIDKCVSMIIHSQNNCFTDDVLAYDRHAYAYDIDNSS